MFIASARANQLCHQIIPGSIIGMNMAGKQVYPATCKPEDVLATLLNKQESLFFFGCYDEWKLSTIYRKHV